MNGVQYDAPNFNDQWNLDERIRQRTGHEGSHITVTGQVHRSVRFKPRRAIAAGRFG